MLQRLRAWQWQVPQGIMVKVEPRAGGLVERLFKRELDPQVVVSLLPQQRTRDTFSEENRRPLV